MEDTEGREEHAPFNPAVGHEAMGFRLVRPAE